MPLYQKSLAAEDDIPINDANFPSAIAVFDFENMTDPGEILNFIASRVGTMAVQASLATLQDGLCINGAPMTANEGLPAIGAKHAFGFQIGKSAAGAAAGVHRIGANPGVGSPGIRLQTSGGTCAISDGTTLVQSPTMLDGDGTTLQAHMCIYEQGVTLRASNYDGSTWTDHAPADISGLGTITLADELAINANSRSALVGWFFFNELPSDVFLKAAVAWSYDRFAKDGGKVLYPPLAGR